MSVTVACVFVQGHVDFRAVYVERLLSMVSRHIAGRFRFVCLTDRPQQMPPNVEAVRIEHPPHLLGWWAKIHLWRPGLFSGRVLYLDLDVLVVSALAPIIEYPARLALVPDGAPHFLGRGALKVVKRYNSSVMVWDAGVATELYSQWSPQVTRRLWGDQDLIGERLPNEATMPASWFPRLSEVTPPWPQEAKVILCKRPKNLEAERRWPWFAQHWR